MSTDPNLAAAIASLAAALVRLCVRKAAHRDVFNFARAALRRRALAARARAARAQDDWCRC